MPDGPIEISVTMCDCNDNCTESPPISYTVDNTLSVPDTINITSAIYNEGGFNIEWEKSLDLDFYQYDLYYSPSENIDDTLKIFTTNDINKTSYFIESINSVPANPLIYNHFYVVVIDTFNYSAISEMYQTSPDPYPIQINITSINYDSDQMTITWQESQDVDFLKYELYMGKDSTNSSLLRTVTSQTTTQHQLNDFNPHIKNYFKIDVYDIFEQKTSGYYASNNIQPIPDDIILDPINSFGNEFTITWSPYFEDDFKQYELYQSNDASMTDSILLFSSTNNSENSYISLDNNYEETYFFKVYMIDDWDYKVPSNIQFIDPEYYTFIHNYSPESETAVGYYGIQNSLGKYIIIGNSTSDVMITITDRAGDNPSFYNYNYGLNDKPVKIIETDNQNYVFLSSIVIDPVYMAYFQVTKTDQYGQSIWSKEFGELSLGEQGNFNSAHDISLTSDGGYIITGQRQTGTRDKDLWILKLDYDGEIEIDKYITAVPQQDWEFMERGCKIVETSNGYTILGALDHQSPDSARIWLTEWSPNISDNGDTLWSSSFDPGIYDYPTSLITNLENGYTLFGYSSNQSSNPSSANSWMIKTDLNGNQIFNQTLDDGAFIYNAIQIHNGDYIIAGKKITNSNTKAFVKSYDENGNVNWEKIFGDIGVDEFYSVEQTNDGGFILTGKTDSNTGSFQIFHVKTDPEGNVIEN